MAGPAIFNGNSIKLLKAALDLFGNAQIISGALDPSSVAVSAPKGSLYLSTSSGLTYQKQDAGLTTNWIVFASNTPNNIEGGAAETLYTSDQVITCGTPSALAKVLQFRQGTAATWTSANPILSSGEIGYETDTGFYKLGNAVTAWNSLSYGGLKGPASSNIAKNFGDGSDGNVTISSGTTTLTKDMYYNNLTMSGSGILIANGYRIFIAGTLDITAAAVGAIRWNGNSGNNASTFTGGAIATAQTAQSIGGPGTGNAGGTGPAGGGAGANGTAAAALAAANGGTGGNGGGGGASTNAAGSGASGGSITASLPIQRWEYELLRGITLIQGGTGGGGAGSGGGDGTQRGGGGGGGGNGGGLVAIWANVINRGGSTSANCIQANGGLGGSGSSNAGNAGGGGGGAGGGGGNILIFYNNLTGSSATNALQAAGGTGGNGGNGTGSGTGGFGGDGGAGGRITLLQISLSSGTSSFGTSGSSGGSPSGPTAGSGGAGNNLQVNL